MPKSKLKFVSELEMVISKSTDCEYKLFFSPSLISLLSITDTRLADGLLIPRDMTEFRISYDKPNVLAKGYDLFTVTANIGSMNTIILKNMPRHRTLKVGEQVVTGPKRMEYHYEIPKGVYTMQLFADHINAHKNMSLHVTI